MSEYGKEVAKKMSDYMGNIDSVDKEVHDIQHATKGVEVRGALAAGVSKAHKVSKQSESISDDTKRRQDSVEQQFDDLQQNYTEDSPSDAEIVAARTNTETGDNHTTVGRRMDAEYKQVTAQLAESTKFGGQIDYVKFIEDRTSYGDLRIMKTDNPYESLKVVLANGNDHITHDFKKNTNDDFWIFNSSYAGKLITIPQNYKSSSSRSGAWSELSGSNRFTTETGASFMVEIKGESLELQHYADNRGGIFEVVVNEDLNNPIMISTFSRDAGNKRSFIIDGLDPNATHKVVGVFKGEDPNNPPQGGVPRGWIKDSGGNVSDYTMIGGVLSSDIYERSTPLLAFGSNKEFAFDLEVDGERNWFPEHNTIGTAFKLEEPKVIIDDKHLSLDEMKLNESTIGYNVQFVQKVACRFPENGEEIAVLEITHNINVSGTVSVTGRIEFLKNTLVKNGYTMMLPLVANTLKEFVSSIGNGLESKGNDSVTYFTEEGDKTYSFAGVDKRHPDFISSVSFDYPLKTLRAEEGGRGSLDRFFYLHERENHPKLYARLFDESQISSGETYKFQGRYSTAKIKNVFNYIK